jgi:hypothetical protein
MTHTISVSSHFLATGHSASGHSGGLEGFVEKSLERLWNSVLSGAGHHFGYKFYGVIVAVAVIAGIWLWVKRRRRAARTQALGASRNAAGAERFGADEATSATERPSGPRTSGPAGSGSTER